MARNWGRNAGTRYYGTCNSLGKDLDMGPPITSCIFTKPMRSANSNTQQYHRTCSPQGPLSWEAPYSVSQMLTPEILFLSVPRSQIHITGPFESTLRELFIKLGIPNPTPDRILVPAIAQQRPAIKSRFPNVYVVGTEQAFAQASTRTITLRSELRFKYCLKLSLACEITSAMRTITPWSAMGGPAVSELLVELVPPNLWIYREIASVTGAQADFNEARHFSCILREDVEFRAREQGETLIVAAALAQRTVGRSVTYAERLFALDSLESKLSWLRRCVGSPTSQVYTDYV